MGRPTTPLFMGVDLGTSGVKSILVDADGAVVAQATTDLSLDIPRPGWSEQRPEVWWSAVISSIQELHANLPSVRGRVAAIGLSGQMHGAVFLDGRGAPLRPAILWNDQRSDRECVEITERLGFERLVQLTGNRAYPGFQAPKILWVRKHEPEIYDRTATILLPKDYINYRLTGVMATEPSDASGTLLYDVPGRSWSQPVLEELGISPTLLPRVIGSSAVAGGVTAQVAAETGLSPGTPVVAGGADNACAALAAAITGEEDVMVSVGTSGTVVAAAPEPRIDPQARLHTFCHAIDGVWYSMGVVLSAGASLSWFRDTLEPAATFDEITRDAAAIPIGSDGLIFLPYLSGERTPHADASARGVFFGLSLLHTRPHMARAVLEGIAFALRDSLELMKEPGIRPRAARLTAGGAQSTFWVQMFADVLGLPVSVGLSDAGPAFGAAILAGAGVGVFESPAAAAHRFSQLGPETRPDPERQERYERQYALYRSLYPTLADVFKAAASRE
jgi:xylulokinase